MHPSPKSAPLNALRITGIAAAVVAVFSAGAADARIATNRIATNRIATNRIATNRIATNGIPVNGRAAVNPFAGLDRKPIAR